MPKSWYTPATRAEELDIDLDDVLDQDRRKAVFRDIGRAIHSGRNPDTAATIGRALERAFRAGLEVGKTKPDFEPLRGRGKSDGQPQKPKSTASKTIDHKSMSDRAWAALSTLSLLCTGDTPGRTKLRLDRPERTVMLRAGVGINRNALWIICGDKGDLFAGDTFGANTISPLLQLGLLAEMPENTEFIALTARGFEICLNGEASMSTPDHPLWQFKTPEPPGGPSR